MINLQSYNFRFFGMLFAATLIPIHMLLLGTIHMLITNALFLLAAPIIGLALGIVDAKLSESIVSRLEQARLELDEPRIRSMQEPYITSTHLMIIKVMIYTFGEEAIRSVIMMYIALNGPGSIYAWLVGMFMFFFARPIPNYLRAVKLIDDAVLSAIVLFGGLIPAWAAHTVMNLYILWPLAKHGGKSR